MWEVIVGVDNASSLIVKPVSCVNNEIALMNFKNNIYYTFMLNAATASSLRSVNVFLICLNFSLGRWASLRPTKMPN